MKRILMVLAAGLVAYQLLAAEHGLKILDDAWVRAVNENDLNELVGLYAPDAVLYAADRMEVRGREAIRAHLKPMFTQNKIQDAKITVDKYETSGDLSAGWGRYSFTLIPNASGEPHIAVEGRFTAVARRIRGQWFYVADHISVLIGRGRN